MLQQRDDRLCEEHLGRKQSRFLNSWFIPKLMGTAADSYDFSGVVRWTKELPEIQGGIFSLRLLLAPVNVGNMHWCLVCVDFDRKTIQYYDSMNDGGLEYLRAMRRYLGDHHRATYDGAPLDSDAWTLVPTTPTTPQQSNGYDCGVFATFCAHYLAYGISPDLPSFSQDDVRHLRRRMMIDILNKRLVSESG